MVTVSACDTKTPYTNLNWPFAASLPAGMTSLDAFTSCTRCTKGVPVNFLAFNGTQFSIVPYNLTMDLPNATLIRVDLGMRCVVPETENTTTFSRPQAILPYCAYYVYQTNVNRVDKNPLICAACLPGYFPSYDQSGVTACTPIANCNTDSPKNTALNACASCLTGFAHLVSNSTINTTVCAPSQDPNCLAVDNVGLCQYCQPGYSLDFDHYCTNITVANCDAFSNSTAPYNNTFPDMSFPIYLASLGHGCQSCSSGYSRMITDVRVCHLSARITAGNFSAASAYISNCISYGVSNDRPVCLACNVQFILSADKTACYNATDLLNCQIASSLTTCSICLGGFVLVAGACVQPAIPNCASYKSNMNEQQCEQCASGYYLSANTCLPGTIANCNIYLSQFQCSKCADYSQLVIAAGSSTYCFPTPSQTNCQAFDSALFDAQQLSCTSCNTGYALNTTTTSLKYLQCLPLVQIKYCVLYDISSSISSSSLMCLKCQPKYFVNQTTRACSPRTANYAGCAVPTEDTDACTTCKPGYLRLPSGACVQNAQGIIGCASYSNLTTCTACRTASYLTNNTCVALSQPLSNCAVHTSPTQCKQCVQSYILTNGTCQVSTASGCLTYASLTACATCPPKMFLTAGNSTTDCLPPKDANCLEQLSASPYNCTKCKSAYFASPQTGGCLPVTYAVENCTAYAADGLCAQCNPFSMLSVDQKACVSSPVFISQLDPNCIHSVALASPICTACKPGYSFVNDSCQTCSSATSCLICSRTDPGKCFICQFGYYMDPNGICIQQVFTAQPTTPVIIISSPITSIVSVMLILLSS